MEAAFVLARRGMAQSGRGWCAGAAAGRPGWCAGLPPGARGS